MLAGLMALMPYSGAEEVKANKPEIKINGDTRQRYLGFRDRFGGAPDLDVFSSRFRINPSLRVNENVEVNARGVAEYSSRPNLDSKLTDGQEFSVDRAFVKIKDGKEGKLTLEAGERAPFSNATIPLIDRDVPVVGVGVEFKPFKGISLQGEYGSGALLTDDSKLRSFGGQVVAERGFVDGGVVLQGNAGYQNFSGNDSAHQFTNSKDAKFGVANAGLALAFPKLPVVKSARVYAEVLHNFEMPNANNALMTGFKIGNADKPNGFEFFAFYNVKVEKDSYPAALMDRDCPRTNFGAYGVGVRWSPIKDVSIYAVSRNPRHIIPAGRKDDQRMRNIECGVTWKF